LYRDPARRGGPSRAPSRRSQAGDCGILARRRHAQRARRGPAAPLL